MEYSRIAFPDPEEEKKKKVIHNDIRDIRSFKQLDRTNLDLGSPRFMQACSNLGIDPSECLKKYASG